MNKRTDSELHKHVVDELAFEPSVNMEEISVAVKDGIVTLSGSVPNYFEKWAAETAVKRVHGVEGVAEELRVKFVPDFKYTDTDIATAARHAIKWGIVVPEEQVQIKVENGWITLEGHVEWQYQRQNVHNAVAYLRGVTGVTNLIALRHSVTPTDIREKIELALKRSAELEANHVQVTVDGGSVTLKGHLPTFGERDAANHAAWSAKGVTSVNNQILIGY